MLSPAPPLRRDHFKTRKMRTGSGGRPTVNVQKSPGADGRHAAAAEDGLALVEAGVAERRAEDGQPAVEVAQAGGHGRAVLPPGDAQLDERPARKQEGAASGPCATSCLLWCRFSYLALATHSSVTSDVPVTTLVFLGGTTMVGAMGSAGPPTSAGRHRRVGARGDTDGWAHVETAKKSTRHSLCAFEICACVCVCVRVCECTCVCVCLLACVCVY